MEKAAHGLVEWCCQGTKANPRRPLAMKLSRDQVRRKIHALPELRFEDQKLTSFAGLFVFQLLFQRLDLKHRLRNCFRHLRSSRAYDHALAVLGLIVHLLLGFRQLRDERYYRDDPMVQRVLGLHRLPDVATVSRLLATATADGVASLRQLCRQLVLEALGVLSLRRLTLDFDGSVIGTGRYAEGTAVGFNRKKKGQRSYYPLFCTIAQTGQVFDVFHRPGNVHDSNGARDFILACISTVRATLPGIHLEVRMDGAFFSDALITLLTDDLGVEFTISVPFERFVELKSTIESRRRWRRLDQDLAYFELRWKPKKWNRSYRFLFVRTRATVRDKEPVQLDLFIPQERGYEFKVIVTNKIIRAKEVILFHNGRGAQEGVFAELKSEGQLDYVPTRTLAGNQIFLLSAVLAHNLNRDLQMITREPDRKTTPKRSPLWRFERLETIRRKLIQRAGRFTQPQGRLTLTLSTNSAVQGELLHYRDELDKAA
jgi:Transposase DDE domain group 1